MKSSTVTWSDSKVMINYEKGMGMLIKLLKVCSAVDILDIDELSLLVK